MKISGGSSAFFPRREITALVRGPGNTAVYRHILVIPLTAKVLLPKNGKPPTAKTIPPCCITAKKNTAIFWFYRVCQKSTANSSYRQKVPPTLNTAKRVSPTLDTADIGYSPKGTADTGYRRKGIAHTGYRPKSTGFFFRVRSLFFLVLRVPFR